MKIIAYTYLIGWTTHNKWYYGKRTAKNCKPQELWKTYFTSSKYVKQFRYEYGEPDVVAIRRTFDNIPQCSLWEQKVLRRLKVVHNSNFLNMSTATGHMDTSGVAPAKIKDTNESLGLILLSDPRWATEEIVGINYGNKYPHSSENKKGQILVKDNETGEFVGQVLKTHPNILAGKWIHVRKNISWTELDKERNRQSNRNRVNIRLPDGSVQKIHKTDSRWTNKEYHGTSKDFVWIYKLDQNIQKTINRTLLSTYLNQGWKRGMLPPSHNTICSGCGCLFYRRKSDQRRIRCFCSKDCYREQNRRQQSKTDSLDEISIQVPNIPPL